MTTVVKRGTLSSAVLAATFGVVMAVAVAYAGYIAVSYWPSIAV